MITCPDPNIANAVKKHITRWENCKKCKLCQGRRHVVFARGVIPCDVCFIGIGPGKSEDTLGEPFVGPAGHRMDQIIARAFEGYERLRYALGNLICCIPKDDDGTEQSEPDEEDVQACAPRLREFVTLCDPKLIVCVGKVVKSYLVTPKPWLPDYKGRFVAVTHPSAILQMPIAQKSSATQDCVVKIASAIEDLFGNA